MAVDVPQPGHQTASETTAQFEEAGLVGDGPDEVADVVALASVLRNYFAQGRVVNTRRWGSP